MCCFTHVGDGEAVAEMGHPVYWCFGLEVVQWIIGIGFGGLQVGEQGVDDAEGLLFDDDFGARGEGTEVGVRGDLFDLLGVAFGFAGPGKVEAGDLETVEQEASAFEINLVGGDALQDLSDGALDCAAIFRRGEVEAGLAAATLAGAFYGFASGVVVVAEFFVAEAGATAAVSFCEDVSALKAFGFARHGGIPSVYLKC